MVPRRIDRAAIRARLTGVDGDVIEYLADAFEPAASAAAAKAAKREKKTSRRRSARPPAREGSDD